MPFDAHGCIATLAALSLSMDAANARPPETSLRIAVLAVGLADVAGLTSEQRAHAYFTALLRFLGCTSFAHEESELFGGDDVEARRIFGPVNADSKVEIMRATLETLANEPRLGGRIARLTKAAISSQQVRSQLAASTCEGGQQLAARLGMPTAVCTALGQIHERWDGRGLPAGLREDETSLPQRVVQVAYVAEMSRIAAGHEGSGHGAAIEAVRSRLGRQLDPNLARCFLREAEPLLGAISKPSVWDRALAIAPMEMLASSPSLDDITLAFADFADLKATYTLGHGRAVADLALRAGRIVKLDDGDLTVLHHAGRLHDLGHVGVATGLWEQSKPLSEAQWDRVRLHPVHTERALARSPALASAGTLCMSHHERLDGSGYPGRAPASAQTFAARLLAAADVFTALQEPRPHRPARSLDEASAVLEAEVAHSRLDREAVRAILEASHRPARAQNIPWPAGLTDREVETLRLVAVGLSNKEIGNELGISSRTVQHHVQHGYDKLGVSTRAAAALRLIDLDLLRR